MGGQAPLNSFHAVNPSRQRTFAGPFLRYHDVQPAGPSAQTWLGSVLFLTKHEPRGVEASSEPTGSISQTRAAPIAAAGAAADPPATAGREGGGSCGSSLPPTRPAPPELLLEDPSSDAEGPGVAQPPSLLDTCLGWHFWRFDLKLELGAHQRPISYSVRWAPSGASSAASGMGDGGIGSSSGSSSSSGGGTSATKTYQFWLPAVGQSFHAAYYSCNGFSSSRSNSALCLPLWLWFAFVWHATGRPSQYAFQLGQLPGASRHFRDP
jgi:hypothetical protein